MDANRSPISQRMSTRACPFRIGTARILFVAWAVLAVMGDAHGQNRTGAKRSEGANASSGRPSSTIGSGARTARSQATNRPTAGPGQKPEALPIWSPRQSGAASSGADGYFRRVMDLPEVEKSFVDVQSSAAAEVYFNGRRIRTVKPNGGQERVELQPYVRPGKNVLAIRVLNRGKQIPGLKADFYFKPRTGNWRVVVTDQEWLASEVAAPNWQAVQFNDSEWPTAIDLRTLSKQASPKEEPASVDREAEAATSAPLAEREIAMGDRPTPPDRAPLTLGSSEGLGSKTNRDGAENPLAKRFTTVPGFGIEQVADAQLGSLLAMTFNEFGHIIASVEGGGLVLLYDSDRDGIPDKSREYCDLVSNVQGLLALNGDVYVTGDGPEGAGLYRLIDSDRNGALEKAELLTKFNGMPGEHGVHQIAFGPDGFLYITVGNHVSVPRDPEVKHPYAAPYEGDLVRPRFEDPGGHASGVKAPGGTVLRYDLTQRKTSIVAGGLRNAYDIAFHPSGAMYLHDSDMEADIGAVWHRATGLFRIVEGGEYGWRSGWANWPDYYLDRLPSLADTGRGSPTGIAVYNHFAFPARYHRALFTADWSEGRIIALQVENAERGPVKAEDFVVGTPMNVTDLEVGPDGALYFCTGGRGTEGGVFRIVWQGEIPNTLRDLGDGISKAIRQPQLYSAFARQSVAVLKREMGDEWDEQVMGVAFSEENPARYRLQALDLMQLLGPLPTAEMLVELSKTANEHVRAKAARLLGLHAGDDNATLRLRRLSQDAVPGVRLAACESLVRIGAVCEMPEIESLLASEQREERYFGRRLLMNVPVESWKDSLLRAKTRVAIQSSLALVSASPSAENGRMAVESLMRVAEGFVTDAEFIDLLRTMQVAMSVGKLPGDAVPGMREFVEREFPTGNAAINGELVRLATHLRCDLVAPCVEYLKMDVPMPERMLIAMHLPLMPHEWTSLERMAVLQFLETALQEKSGGSYPLYIMRTSEELSKHLTEKEALQILELGQRYPNAALSALFKIPDNLTPEQIQRIQRLDSAIDKGGLEEDVFKRLKTGITAILSQQADESAMEYLRQRWRKSPDRRATIALAMAQRPSDANWDYLVRSMGVLDLFAVGDVCKALMDIDAATEDPEAIRQTILQGCRLAESGEDPSPAIRLLEYWTAQKPNAEELQVESDTPMAVWQAWFELQFPNSPPAVLPSETAQPRWSIEFLEQYLDGEQGKFGSMENGSQVYAKARCSACHRMNSQGGGYGPDLTSINRRFTRTEVLESILFPSHVISDQYATKKVLTKNGEVYTGILVKATKGVGIRVNENKEFVVPEDEIDELVPSKVSAMPAGLLDDLTPTEIRDLMCYLGFLPSQQMAQEKPITIRR